MTRSLRHFTLTALPVKVIQHFSRVVTTAIMILCRMLECVYKLIKCYFLCGSFLNTNTSKQFWNYSSQLTVPYFTSFVLQSQAVVPGYHVTLMINPDHRNLSICNPVYIQNSFHYPSINPETVSIQFQWIRDGIFYFNFWLLPLNLHWHQNTIQAGMSRSCNVLPEL